MFSEKKKKNDDNIATLSAVSKVTSKKYLDETGLGHLSSLIISFVRNYAAPKTHNHDGSYAAKSHAHTTAQVTGLDSALAGKAPTGHNHDGVYAKTAHTHSTDNITSGTLPVARGGTGQTSAVNAASALINACEPGTAAPSDDDWYVAKYAASGNNTPVKRTHSALWSYIKSKTDPLYQPRGSYAASSHTHSIANVTNLQSSLDGKAAVSHGHSAVTTSAAGFMSAADKSKLDGIATGANKTIVDSSLSSTSVNPVQNKVVNSALAGKASTSHTHTTAQVSGLDAALAGKASTSHNHTIAQVTNLQTELDKKQVKIQPVTTAGTGSAYTATVSHIKALTAGVEFTMIPNVVSASVSPTLNVNGLGAKQIRQRLSNGTVSTATGATANWLAAGKPVDVMYDGAFWVVDFARPNMTSAYGTLPVANGGTGCTSSSDAASHLIDSLAVGATTATDNDYLICQVPNSGTAHKRPMSVVWNWVKAKCDSIYQPKGSYASSSHTHNIIKDIGDGRDITFNYSADGAQDATWFAVWNGSELKAMSKQQMKSSLGISSSGVNLGKLMYPVGAVYISWSSTSPASLFGGSWVAITGRFPYFNAGTSTGGNNTHTLTGGQIPDHSHNISHQFTVSGNGGGGASGIPGGQPSWGANGQNTGWNTPADWFRVDGVYGSFGGSHNNMPAYQTLYAWRRTA